jgi:TIR domain/Sulfatase-modifying factor enzyme 1
MAHDVFISHSTKNKAVADAVCATLEKAAIRCWIAPRDVQPGRPFAGEITRAINRSKAMVLIFSADSNSSPQILRELQLAADARLHIIPFRIEDLAPNEDLAYYLAGSHWFDATTAPLEQHLGRFAISLKPLLGPPEKGASNERPYENSLGMKFVPLAGTGLLCSVWETRLKDYAAFVKETRREWTEPDFKQTEEHPAVNVSWDDAVAFCQWLTKKERKAGRIGVNQSYRLPSDLEWSAAVGLEDESGDMPEARSSKVEGVYPWGNRVAPTRWCGELRCSFWGR